jgi:hypothetical protein
MSRPRHLIGLQAVAVLPRADEAAEDLAQLARLQREPVLKVRLGFFSAPAASRPAALGIDPANVGTAKTSSRLILIKPCRSAPIFPVHLALHRL